MEREEFDSLVLSLRQSGLKDEDILGIFVTAFEEKKCDQEDLEVMFHWMGKVLTDEFFEFHNIERIFDENMERIKR